MPLGPMELDGSHKFAGLADLARGLWAVVRGFPGRYQNTGDDFNRFSWAGHRGAYDDWTTHSNESVGQDGVKQGIDPNDNTPSISYAVPTMGYNRVRVFARATGSGAESLGIRAYVWRDEMANEAEPMISLAAGIPADGKWHFVDSDAYLGPWAQFEARAEGDYTLTAVTVTVHLWKE